MEKFLSFVSIDVWSLIFTWANLLILFLILKKILFKPIKNIIDQREKEVSDMYENADSAQKNAESLEKEYREKLNSAKEEARTIVSEAAKSAELESESIISDAKKKAELILKNADEQIETDKRRASSELKKDIASIAVSIAEKVIEKNINQEDNERLIEDFIDGIGDDK